MPGIPQKGIRDTGIRDTGIRDTGIRDTGIRDTGIRDTRRHTVIRRSEARCTETPNAVMTTLASPTQGDAGQAVWRMDMRPGQAGPLHGADTEQVLTVLAGAAVIDLAGESVTLEAGDTVVIPADTPRRVATGTDTALAAIVLAPAGVRVYPLDGTVPAADCAARDGDKLAPRWVV